MSISTSLSTSILQSTVSRSTLTEAITSHDQCVEGNGTSPTPYLTWWDVNAIEATLPNASEISTS